MNIFFILFAFIVSCQVEDPIKIDTVALQETTLKPEGPKPEVLKPEDPKPEVPKPEDPKPEVPKPEVPKPEDPKPEVPKPEVPKPEVPKPEVPKPEVPKIKAVFFKNFREKTIALCDLNKKIVDYIEGQTPIPPIGFNYSNCNTLDVIYINIEADQKDILDKTIARSMKDNGAQIARFESKIYGLDFDKFQIQIASSQTPKFISAKARFKGDLLDHTAFSMPSLRVEVETREILGMDKFSIQHPKTRGAYEKFYLDHARDLGFVSPHYEYVNYVVNGEYHGIYAMEEHMGESLLKQTNEENSMLWGIDENMLMITLLMNNWVQSKVDLINSLMTNFLDFKMYQIKKIFEDKLKLSGYNSLRKNMTLYQMEKAPGSLIFDEEYNGKIKAIGRFWKDYHGSIDRLHNRKYFFKSDIMKLRIIPFDGIVGEFSTKRRLEEDFLSLKEQKGYLEQILILKKLEYSGKLSKYLDDKKLKLSTIFHQDVPDDLKVNFSTDLSVILSDLTESARLATYPIYDYRSPELFTTEVEDYPYFQVLDAIYHEKDDKGYLNLRNFIDQDVEIVKIEKRRKNVILETIPFEKILPKFQNFEEAIDVEVSKASLKEHYLIYCNLDGKPTIFPVLAKPRYVL